MWWQGSSPGVIAAAGCAMVLGVAGNHDEVTPADVAGLGPSIALLDGDRHGVGGATVAHRNGSLPPYAFFVLVKLGRGRAPGLQPRGVARDDLDSVQCGWSQP